MNSSYGPLRSRCSALTMPEVTVPCRPSGLPIARTRSPTWTSSLLPTLIAGSGRPTSIFKIASSKIKSLAEQPGIGCGAVLQRHHDFVGVLDHMSIGDDDPAWIVDRAGADNVEDVRGVGDVFRGLAPGLCP